MVKKMNVKRAGFLANADLTAPETTGSKKRRLREEAKALKEEEAPRKQQKWLEEERKQTKLPTSGNVKHAASETAVAADGAGAESETIGKKKAKRQQVLDAKKAQKAQKKMLSEQMSHQDARAKLKGKARGNDKLSEAAADLLKHCPRNPPGEQRLLANVAERVSGNPEKQIEFFDLFFELAEKGANEETKSFALLSAIAVFKDLIPGYKVREPTEQDKSFIRSKELLSTEKYEMILLQKYRRLLPTFEAALRKYPAVFARGLAALVKVACDFNYRQRLISTAVKYANSEDEFVRKVVSEALQEMVEADQRLDASRDVVIQVGNYAQANAGKKGAKRTSLHTDLLSILLRLPLGQAEVAKTREETGLEEASAEVQKNYQESSIDRGSQYLEKAETTLLYEVFCVYLRILRQKHIHGRELVASALVGLARWGQRVNLELLLEILTELKITVNDAIKQNDELISLQGINCALLLLSGPSQALITDATWLPEALNQALILALPSLHSTHSEAGEWPPARCYELVDGVELLMSKKDVHMQLESGSVPNLILLCLQNSARCAHGFGRASDSVLASLMETLFQLAANADPHVGLAILRDASSMLKKQRRLYALLDIEGGLYGLGGVTEKAVSVAWTINSLASSLSPTLANLGKNLPELIPHKNTLISDHFPSKDARAWLEWEFPHQLSALLGVPKPGDAKAPGGKLDSTAAKNNAPFCTEEELRRRLGENGFAAN